MRLQPDPDIRQWFADQHQTRSLDRAIEEIGKCVHCGMCNATCPTYQITGDELDGPRGRIYQIKSLLEGNDAAPSHRVHLDRCLQCRACETTCPSGVGYHHILEAGKTWIDERQPASVAHAWLKAGLGLMRFRAINATLWPLARLVRPLLPATYARKILPTSSLPCQYQPSSQSPTRTYVLFQGCVQPSMLPTINPATQTLMNLLNIRTLTVKSEQCCGALPYHLGQESQAIGMIASNLRHWHRAMQTHHADGIIINASGCGVMVRDYADILAKHTSNLNTHGKPELQQLAKYIADRAFEPVEILQHFTQELRSIIRQKTPPANRLVFQAPCTLQHGMKRQNLTEAWLVDLFRDTEVVLSFPEEPHLCCGSAGTYSVQQPTMSNTLRSRKWNNLMQSAPQRVLSANVGCIAHLAGAASSSVAPVVQHYLEFIAEWATGNRQLSADCLQTTM